ncbi:intein-containing Rv2578c family radical SAM protein [Lacisediminihabitans changchengi]|uniref:Intein-containing Rv2578c family radical SAM protein n=1 Tax=Lacisediminihabitans changchengi TaxID=2787634 RepID=A0A934STM9_9MICO|nr:intein-containing Rv2578c family radical SAM protein [Lacisediminihabitans changchengi]MBK4348773.1 intein-containing Rv2578c family radical SAM protein [Lacisediminihabitans changchengi]
MRWSGQELDAESDAALPGLARLSNLVRSVTTPEFAGIRFHEVLAKSALNRVPTASDMPFGWTINPYRGCSHACSYCLHPETQILMADGRQLPLWQVKIGDRIYGTEVQGNYRRYVVTTVHAIWNTRKPAHRVALADGTTLVSSGDHRFLTDRGWKHVAGQMSGPGTRPHLTINNTLMGFGSMGLSDIDQPQFFPEQYRRGYLTGMIRGDGHLGHYEYARSSGRRGEVHRFRLALADAEALNRTRTYLDWEGIPTTTFAFSPESETRRPVTAIRTSSARAVSAVEELVEWQSVPSNDWHAGFLAGVFDTEGSCSQGGLRISNSDPEIIAQRKLSIEGAAVTSDARLDVVSIEDLGEVIDMIDITTGTGDFIANGVISHNCFARKTHEYLDLDAGKDFDSEIIVKVNVAEVLSRELAKPTWGRHPVALGTNTDPYQRAEGRYSLMPGIIAALAESGTPLSVLTKGTLLRRDLALLSEANTVVPVGLAMSVAIYDDALQQSVEPGTPSTAARLATVKAARELGLDCEVFMMPILPYLTDTREHLEHALGLIRDAGATSVVYGALHLRPGAKEWFMEWLEREHPELVPRYRAMYARNSYAPQEYRAWLGAKIVPLLRRFGLSRGSEDPATGTVRSRSLAGSGSTAPDSLLAAALPNGHLPTLF